MSVTLQEYIYSCSAKYIFLMILLLYQSLKCQLFHYCSVFYSIKNLKVTTNFLWLISYNPFISTQSATVYKIVCCMICD